MPAGRPTVNNLDVLVQINNDPIKKKQLDVYLQNAVHYLREATISQDGYKDVVADAAENLGLAKGFIGKCAKALYNENAIEMLEMAEAIVEAVEKDGSITKDNVTIKIDQEDIVDSTEF